MTFHFPLDWVELRMKMLETACWVGPYKQRKNIWFGKLKGKQTNY
jgi:hypothetical protein